MIFGLPTVDGEALECFGDLLKGALDVDLPTGGLGPLAEGLGGRDDGRRVFAR